MTRSRATADRQGPPLGIIVSVVLHLGLAAAMFITFSKKIDLSDQSTPVVPVDLVTIADQTNITPTVAPQPLVPPPLPEMTEPAPQPDIAPPQFEIAPDAKPVPKKEKNQFDPDKILEALRKHPPANARVAARTIQGAGAQTGMTADLAAVLQSQIYRCWSPPIGSPHPERLIVRYELFLNRDGTVAQTPQLTADSAAAVAGDPYMTAAAQAAYRAIYSCAPYKLPADRYAQWRDVEFTFDPRLLVGQ